MEQRYLKIMELSEILDLSVRLYRKNFIPLVLAQVPLTLTVFFVLMRGGGTGFFDVFNQTPSYTGNLDNYFITMLLSFVQSILVYPLVLGAVTKVASDCILQESPSVKKAYKFALHNKGKLIVTSVVISFAIGLVVGIFISAPLALIIFGMRAPGSSTGALVLVLFALLFTGIGVVIASFLWIRWVTTFPVLVNEEDEDLGTFDAMKRSWNLVQGHTRKLFFVMVAVSLIPTLVQLSPSAMGLFAGRFLAILTVVFGVVAQGLISPLVDCTRVVIYFELKTRKEGFDLEKRVEQLQEV
ncbi:MAG: glycerophosphoryl diester phosphodiesterase membrane domain-containing protein [Theionarchaea archaeon]|nr:glycerophosphoryl diester phosphodiesterase membrane domain-containing protein [Theionarchaea archaeon]